MLFRSCLLQESIKNYDPITLRSVLYLLGYEEDEAEEVLRAVAGGGFEYCLDPAIECNSGDHEKPGRIHPPHFECRWGPDQMRSRLDCVRL